MPNNQGRCRTSVETWLRNYGATQGFEAETPPANKCLPANMCLVSHEKNQAGQTFQEEITRFLYSTVAKLTSVNFDEGDALMILSTCLKWLSNMKNQDLVSKCNPTDPTGQTCNYWNPCQTFTRHTKLVGVTWLRMGFKYSLTRDHEISEFMKKVDQGKLDRSELFLMECYLVELIEIPVWQMWTTIYDDCPAKGQIKKQREKLIGDAAHLVHVCKTKTGKSKMCGYLTVVDEYQGAKTQHELLLQRVLLSAMFGGNLRMSKMRDGLE